ncbi:MAG: YfcE family phosphodiesterase [Myxococcota bacterium]|nr:YfcE family phosphodiesterase [Myxococcota bacterium]
MTPREIGVVADSHGYLCERTLDLLGDVELILHAGDVGGEEVLEGLQRIAPVIVAVGNGDPDLAPILPWEQRVTVGSTRVLLCHWYDNFGKIHPKVQSELDAWDPHVLVYGHTHEAVNREHEGRLHFNPGYSGPPRTDRPRSIGRLRLGPSGVERAEILSLGD